MPSYVSIMKDQRENIGWEKYRVFDGTDVKMCFKCRGFNHKANDCRNAETCFKCHGNHNSAECNSEVILKY